MLASTVKKHFFDTLSHIEENISSYVQVPGSDMTRHRSCDCKHTILATLNLSMNRTNTELFRFFDFNDRIPTKSAFTQQRKKLKVELFSHFLNKFNEVTPFKKTYKGFHLVAVDGSDINLPTNKNDLENRIKQARSDDYYFQLHLTTLYDTCEERYISATTQPRPKMDENAAFLDLVKNCKFPENTIYIADRGFATMNTAAYLSDNGKFFLIRAKSPAGSGSFLRGLMEADVPSDRFVTLNVTRSKKNIPKDSSDLYKVIRRRKFNLLGENDMTSVYTFAIRCTCVELKEGSYEYIISNLPIEKFSASDLKDLYWHRWKIETSFRRLKYALSLSYLHSVNRELIKQEIYAKIILFNFTSLLRAFAQDSEEFLKRVQNRKKQYNVSFDDTVPIAKELLVCSIPNQKIKALLLQHLTVCDTPKKSARHMRSQRVRPLNNRA